jgi:superfamily II DNA or RNA helicase
MAKSSPRCLRSKRLRALLWYAADGKCQNCGQELPDSWHADHVVPYAVSPRTNVHEMQALCPKCNLRKGDSWMILREHQSEIDAHLAGIRSGDKPRTIIGVITPGGGKSKWPIMIANAMIPAGLADFIAWFVPRTSLALQAEDDFNKVDRSGFNPHMLKIRQSTNDCRPCRGTHGFVTTHQALAADTGETVLKQFESARGIVVVDECHHVYAGSPVDKRLDAICAKAVMSILMSGNLTRHDGRRVGKVPYRYLSEKVLAIDYDHPDFKFIRYGRQIALREKAKIPILFAHLDGAASWYDRNGEYCEVDTLKKPEISDPREPAEDFTDGSSPVFAAIQTDYAIDLLTQCCESFVEHRRFVNPTAKVLVVAFSIKEANRYLALIKERWSDLRCGIAVCKDADERDASRQALHAIERFKNKKKPPIDVLITVQMAYEGMDVLPITHLACLTHIRSWPWIEQMLDRGTRYNDDPLAGSWESQRLYAFVPDDARMNDAIVKINAEQAGYVQLPGGEKPRNPNPEPGPGEPPLPPGNPSIIPIDGIVTYTRYTGEHGGTALAVEANEARLFVDLMRRHGIAGSPLELKALLADLSSRSDTPLPEAPGFQLGQPTPSQEEEKLRKGIEAYCKNIDRVFFAMSWGKTNGIVKAEFGKPRDEMDIAELRQVWAFLQRRFPQKEVV